MAQKGIDALAELWEETGTFRIKVEKNIIDGMETLTDGNLATKVFDWLLANLKKKPLLSLTVVQVSFRQSLI